MLFPIVDIFLLCFIHAFLPFLSVHLVTELINRRQFELECYLEMAKIYMHLGNYRLSRRCLDDCLDIGPDYAPAIEFRQTLRENMISGKCGLDVFTFLLQRMSRLLTFVSLFSGCFFSPSPFSSPPFRSTPIFSQFADSKLTIYAVLGLGAAYGLYRAYMSSKTSKSNK